MAFREIYRRQVALLIRVLPLVAEEKCFALKGHIPNAGLLIQPEVSHFSFLQDPQQFNDDVSHFLDYVPWQ